MKIFLIILSLPFLAFGCNQVSKEEQASNEGYYYEGNTKVEIENPYDEGSGHPCGRF